MASYDVASSTASSTGPCVPGSHGTPLLEFEDPIQGSRPDCVLVLAAVGEVSASAAGVAAVRVLPPGEGDPRVAASIVVDPAALDAAGTAAAAAAAVEGAGAEAAGAAGAGPSLFPLQPTTPLISHLSTRTRTVQAVEEPSDAG
jgi:hypothetical protein